MKNNTQKSSTYIQTSISRRLLIKISSITQAIIIFFIRVYQAFSGVIRSTLQAVLGFSFVCHQVPTCSEYTVQQLKQHGTMRGLFLGFIRVMSCWSIPGFAPHSPPYSFFYRQGKSQKISRFKNTKRKNN